MPNELFKEFEKFVNQEVTVEFHRGDEVKELIGKLVFLNFGYLNCVIETEKEKVIVKNIISIKRKKN